MAISNDDEGLGGARASGCASCGAGLAPSQRYCLKCGARRGPLPAAVAKWLSIVGAPATGDAAPGSLDAEDAGEAVAVGDPAGDEAPAARYMPEPRTAAVAVMALLAFGVLLGGVTGPVAQSAGIAPIVLYSEEQVAPVSSPEPVETKAEPAETAPVAASAPAETVVPEAAAPEAAPTTPPKAKAPIELPETETLPPVQHVFLIVLADHGFEETFGETSQAPYLATTLRGKGELLPNYYAVTQGDLANEVALISGQGPNPTTTANCPEYKDIAPGVVDAEGQVEGEGCVYPAETPTLPAQLATAGKSWKAYVEGMGSAGQSGTCRHPAPGSADEAQAPRPGDPYQTWRNPFVYFHSLIDGAECAERDVGLEQLSLDLKKEAKTPSFSYIVADACHDGADEPCEPDQAAGLAAAQPFLETVVPEIEASPAYKTGGLIAITSAQAPQNAAAPDTSACCATPEYPNLPPPATPPPATNGPVKETGGGGQVGMLLLSPFVEPGSVSETGYYNHYSFLLSVEELLGVTPGTTTGTTTPPGYAGEPALTAFEPTLFETGS
ncbi:MAG TPA: alkaline phosphatase family protein [Solirubrobacterales bacterium]|nr:alkaline phosphatase family protein [Solirubrobacterales bacterium]